MKVGITLTILFSLITSGINAQTRSNDPLKELLSSSYLFNNSDQHIGKKKVQNENKSTAFSSRLIAESYYDNTGTIFEKKDTSRYFLSGDRSCEIYDHPKQFDSSYIFHYLVNTNNSNNDSGGGKIYHTFDNNDNIIDKYSLAWDLALNTLDSYHYENYQYDNNNNLLENILMTYTTNNTWHPTQKHLYTYDNDNNMLSHILQSSAVVNNVVTWNNVKRYLYTYSQSNLVGYYSQNWNNNTWETGEYDSLAFNLNDSLVYRDIRGWDNTTNLPSEIVSRYFTEYNNDGCPIWGIGEAPTDTGWMVITKRTSSYYSGSCNMQFDTGCFYSTIYNHMQIGNTKIYNNYIADQCPAEMLINGGDSNNVILSIGRYQYNYNNYNQMTKKRYDIWDNTTGNYVTSPYSFINNYYYEEYGSTQGIGEQQYDETVCIFPNPAKDELNIHLPLNEKQGITMTIMDMLGKTISHLEENATGVFDKKVDVKAIPSGNYILRISSREQNVTRKFAVDRN